MLKLHIMDKNEQHQKIKKTGATKQKILTDRVK